MDDERNTTMGDRLREVRERFGMTQEEFGKRLGGSQQSICQLEKGKRGLTNQMVSSVCANYGINERWFRTGEGEMFKRKEEDTSDLTRQLQRTVCQRIFDALPADVKDTIISICCDELSKMSRQHVASVKKDKDFGSFDDDEAE